ncbi:MAG: right-handed parallel beta-helix repeat-containing protein [Verrucomicrobia bacterium]|nr:right-handed parallel beta-helix repeat-containing protein [Verrucomicrobiota bacterium]
MKARTFRLRMCDVAFLHFLFVAVVVLFPVLAGTVSFARETHVATTGQDTAPGTQEQPLRTLNRAAQLAQPGDIVTVHAGTYREWVKPARGGASDHQRILYRTAPNDKVVIKGSERITNWTEVGGPVWKVELPNSFFREYNPYALQLSGGWLNYGQWHHRGDVYLDEEAFVEQRTLEEVRQKPQRWYCEVQGSTTTIWANFGNANPNQHLAEINVRESLFMPDVSGLSYITIDGFHFLHAAANWAPPGIPLQTGAVGPRLGKRWIIQNCTIVNARCVGIILGRAPGVDYEDIDAFGDHVVRNNVIRRCGQAAIAGHNGATRSLITGNLIEETNYRREFGGWETAAIKFHNSVDTVISNNLIRGVFRQEQGAFGVWMDFGNQGTRITGNIICDTEAEAIFLEMDHGPMLIDNNVILGGGVRANSENMVFAHNLFVDCPHRDQPDLKRQSQFYTPHTTRVVGRKPGAPANNQWFNNLFVGRGLDDVKPAPGYRADFNAFLQGARPSKFGETHSVVDAFAVGLRREDLASGIALIFQMNDAPSRIQAPLVDAERVGVFPPVGQTLEDREGCPITVNTDLLGHRFDPCVPGPLATLQRGENRIRWQRSFAPRLKP